jgi:hypothetical protein
LRILSSNRHQNQNASNNDNNASQFLNQGPLIPAANLASNFQIQRSSNTNNRNNNNNNSYGFFDFYPPQTAPRNPQNRPPNQVNQQRNQNANNNNNNVSNRNSSEPPPPRLPRNGTFVLEVDNTPSPNQTERQVDVNELYNVQRRQRAKTPIAFNFMLNDSVGGGGNNSSMPSNNTNTSGSQPRINYKSKTKAKLIIGKQGRDNGELIWPIDVAINQFNNQIIISDSNNHRIQIFESNGKFVNNFGKQGKRDGQFDSITGLFSDSMSNIFIVDRMNHRIQIFDRYCRFVRSIGSGQGTAPGQLNHPWGLAVSSLSESS